MDEIETIKKTIHKDYHLKRDDKCWKLNEQPTVKIRVPGRHSIGFSLDNEGRPPLAFFSNSPPKNLTRIPDAILALKYNQKVYWFVIEQKSTHKKGYKDQLINGKYFCEWLTALYRQYKYLPRERDNPVYIGLLVRQPRKKSIRKGTSTHGNGLDKNKFRECEVDTFQHSFEIQNIREIALSYILRAL